MSASSAVSPAVSDLESSQTMATWSLIGGIVGGVSLATYAFVFVPEEEDCGPMLATNDAWYDCKVQNSANRQHHMELFGLLGVGVAGLGVLTYVALKPGRSDYLRFVNQHNRINPRSPIRLQMGLSPQRGGALAGVQISFGAL